MRFEKKLTSILSKKNYYSLLWHTAFLSLAHVFMDIDIIIPAMLIDSGGSALQIGFLTAIMLGGSSFSQLLFAPFVSNFHYKKKFLLLGINLRIISLFGLAFLLFNLTNIEEINTIFYIFFFISIFSFGGAFANVSYVDILGKSIKKKSRKSFFSIKQVITATICFSSAFAAKKILINFDYPLNYSYMFFIAFGSLFFASLGFWNIKEVVASKLTVNNFSHFFELIFIEIKENKNLKYFLGFINTMGISIYLLPFLVLYAKESDLFENINTGTFLFYKIIGSVLTGIFLFLFSGKYKYKYLILLSSLLTIFLPLLIILFPFKISFVIIFLIGGIVFTVFTISKNGIMLEISGTSNRTLYAGIAGLGNILPALFSIFSGWVINEYGFKPFFIIFILIVLSSFYFIFKLDCKR